MNQRPFLSIVIPTYNRANLISATLESLLKQNYDHYQLIVVDDGSTDNTEEIIRSNFTDPRILYYKKANAERAAARNYGARIAKGDYVNFFDSDDLALPNHLSEAAELIAAKDNPEWFHLGYAWARPDGAVFKGGTNFVGPMANDFMHKGNLLSCNGVFIRRDVILANLFNEDRRLSASEDYELWLRLSAQFPLHYTNKVTSLVVDHDARSVHKINGQKLVERLEAFLNYVSQNSLLRTHFGPRMKRIQLEGNSYMALHLANLAQYKGQSVRYLLKSIAVYPSFIFSKRFYATIKNLIIKWQTS